MTTKTEILKSIRAKCIDCCVGNVAEVKLCTAKDCDLWPFRSGKDPNPARGAPKNAFASKGVTGSKSKTDDAFGYLGTQKSSMVKNAPPVCMIPDKESDLSGGVSS